MSNILKAIGKFLAKLGAAFSSLITGAEKAWKKTEPDIQDAILKASGIVDVINRYVNETPKFIYEMIKAKFPDFDEQKIKKLLVDVAKEKNLISEAINPDLNETIQALARYLQSKTGSKWAQASEDIAGLLAILLAPGGTPWNKIGTLIWFAYQRFVKGKK